MANAAVRFAWWACVIVVASSVYCPLPAYAELQNVQVGGEVRIRGNYWKDAFTTGSAPQLVRNEVRWPALVLRGRPVGRLLGAGDIVSHFDWSSRGAEYRVVEQRTTLHARADFTDNVSAFVEFDNFSAWGEDFRANYVTGIDQRALTSNNVEVYQAFIETNDMFGAPLRARIGRQELVFGDGWLVGNNSALPEFVGVSFDGIRLTYASDTVDIDAFWTRLRELSPLEEDGDTDFYGIYASCHALENVTFDLFWLWLRDAAAVKDTNGAAFPEMIEDWLGRDDYAVTTLHTVGLRASGNVDAFDFNVQGAYQFGDASQVGALFRVSTYGDDDASFDAWAAEAEAGYTLDVKFQPRFYLGGAYFDGEDHREFSFGRPRASVSFNRLFSNRVYSCFIDEMGELSNFWTARAGATLHWNDAIQSGVSGAYFGTVETFDQPIHAWYGANRLPLAPLLVFWTEKSPADIGWQLDLWTTYQYSADLAFKGGWSHLFTGAGLQEGNYNDLNGLLFNGGIARHDADYFYLETKLAF